MNIFYSGEDYLNVFVEKIHKILNNYANVRRNMVMKTKYEEKKIRRSSSLLPM